MLRRSKNLLPRLVTLSQGQSTAAAQNILDSSILPREERGQFSGAGSPLSAIIRGGYRVISDVLGEQEQILQILR